MTRRRKSVRRTLSDFPPPTPQPTPCRLWQGVTVGSRFPYGARTDGSLMHRWVWEQTNGPIPAGLVICHRCDHPPCYRLDHLFLGTRADNNHDMIKKGRYAGLPERLLGVEHPRSRLDDDKVREIRSHPLKKDVQRALAARFGVGLATIRDVQTGRTWRHVA
jgi:hypothetical protein